MAPLCAKNLLLLCLVPFLLGARQESSNGPDAHRTAAVRYRDGELSIGARGIPLEALLAEIQQETGVTIEVRDPRVASVRVTVELGGESVADAMKQILRDYSYLLAYDGERLTSVVVLPQGPVGETRSSGFKPDPGPARKASMGSPGLIPSPDAPPDFERLLEQNPEKGIDTVSRTLKGNDSDLKLIAMDALLSIEDPRALDLLSQGLRDPDSMVKRFALDILRDKKDEGATEILTAALLDDKDPSFRIEVMESLVDRGETSVLRSVGLSDPNEQVRQVAADLLESYQETPGSVDP